jgi:regulator of RNase E activity RraA
VSLSDRQLQALRQIDACTLANAIEVLNQRLRNEGFMSSDVRCLLPERAPMVGHAATVQIRGSAPPLTDGPYPDRTDWWDYVLSVPAPRIVVIQDVATRPGLGSLVGEVHMNILMALGCEGVVTNGAVRDIPAAAAAKFPLFAGGVSVSHGYLHIVNFGEPVEVAGLVVRSGDVLHGDVHGVQSVPEGIVDELPAVAQRLRAREQELISLCRAPGFSLDKLRAALSRQDS